MSAIPLSQAIRQLSRSDGADPVLAAGVQASVATLNEGVVQTTRLCGNGELHRKHRARLRAALAGIADALELEEQEAALEAAFADVRQGVLV